MASAYWLLFFLSFSFSNMQWRVLHESLYGYRQSAIERSTSANQLTTPASNPLSTDLPPFAFSPRDRNDSRMDADLAMALRISEQEQQRIAEEIKREEEMLAEVLLLSLEEKWSNNKKQLWKNEKPKSEPQITTSNRCYCHFTGFT